MAAVLERLLRRDRLIVGGSLVLVAALAWGWILAGAGMGMSGLEMTRHTLMDMDMMPAPSWSLGFVILMFFMWWVMMIAMMVPGAVPTILVAAALNRRADPERQPFGSAGAFTSGYLLAWAAFSAAAVAAQWGLQRSGLVSSMLYSNSRPLSGALLAIAGIWQFTPWKHACLSHCRGPVEFLVRQGRPGQLGALRMGLHHGAYCLGCCWFLMALLFVGGVMNLYWILGLTIYVWIEKVLPGGIWAARAMGAALLAASALVLFGLR